jgi:hypothetical protein
VNNITITNLIQKNLTLAHTIISKYQYSILPTNVCSGRPAISNIYALSWHSDGEKLPINTEFNVDPMRGCSKTPVQRFQYTLLKCSACAHLNAVLVFLKDRANIINVKRLLNTGQEIQMWECKEECPFY